LTTLYIGHAYISTKKNIGHAYSIL